MLAFTSTRTGYQEIWAANADGSQAVQLTDLRHRYADIQTAIRDASPFYREVLLGNRGLQTWSVVKPQVLSADGMMLFYYLGEDWAKYNQMYDPKTELTDHARRRVFDFAKLVTSASDTEFAI